MTIPFQSTVLSEKLAPIFKTINNENWDQSIGYISLNDFKDDKFCPGFKCCVGAHIAFALRKKPYSLDIDDDVFYFEDGEHYVLELLKEIYPEMRRFMMYALFHCAGAPPNPFAPIPWKFKPIDVLERMKYIETLPPDPNVYGDNFTDYYTVLEDYYNSTRVINWIQEEQYNIRKNIRYPDPGELTLSDRLTSA